MKALKDRVNEKLRKLIAPKTPAAANLILAGAVALLLCIFVLSTTSKADDVVLVGHESDSVNLRDGRVTVEIWWPEGGADEAAYFLQHAIEALPLIQELVGFSPVNTSLRIELGHNHADTALNTVRIAGCLDPDIVGCTVEGDFWLLLHELIHTFLPSWMSTSWFAEATANITGVVVRAQLGLGNFDIPRDAVERRVMSSEERAIEEGWLEEDSAAITILSDLEPHPLPGGDEYLIGSVVGDVFLGKVYLLLGHDLFSRAYASLARQNPTLDNPLTNEDIRDAFLDRASGLDCAYRELVWLYLDRNNPVDCNLAPDLYETNDSFDEAASVGPGRYNLSLHEASDRDYFTIPVPEGHTLRVSISSLLGRRVDSFLYDSDNNSIADFGIDEEGNITAEYTTDRPDIFFLKIFSEQGSILLYDLKVGIYGKYKAHLPEDEYEDNDSLEDAVEIGEGLHELTIDTRSDDDWYYIDVPPNHWLEIEISNVRQYAELDAWIKNSNGRLLAVARPEGEEGEVKTARAFIQPCHAEQRLYIHVTGSLDEYAQYISEYNLRINLVEEGFNPQRLCDIASLLAETDQSNVFNLFAEFPGRIQFGPCLTCSLQDNIDKGMMIKVFVKEEGGKKVVIDPIPTLVQFNKGASRLAYLTRQLNKLAKEWIPSVLFNGPSPDF